MIDILVILIYNTLCRIQIWRYKGRSMPEAVFTEREEQKMKRKLLVILIGIIAVFSAGCSRNGKEVVETLTECTDLELPEGYVIEMVQEVEKTNQLFVVGANVNAADYTDLYQLFQMEKTKTGYQNVQKIEIEDSYLVADAVVSDDGKKVYFSAYLIADINPIESKMPPYKIYMGSLEESKVTNIEEIEEANIDGFSILADVDSKDNLYFASIVNNAFTAYRAVKQEAGYQLEELSLSEEVENASSAIFLEKEQQAIMGSRESEWLSDFYLVNFDGNIVTDSKELQMPEEISAEYICNVSLSTDENMFYIITCPDKDDYQTRKVYKISLSALLNNQKEAVVYEGCTYDTYDTSVYEMKYRKKGNIKAKQGVYYEIFVRSFADSDGDGIGDFNGITAKLDYLQELGIDGIWLMPINASSSYHGYDVTDYNAVNEEYGTEEDLENLLKEAHKRNIKVIMDFVINHTSSEHPWFQNAITDENNEYRNYYRWVKKEDKSDYSSADVSNWGDSVWHKNGTDYYYGIFSAGMPDLNYNNPKVREEVINAAQKWLKLGIDGFRLDAAMHIYGDNEFKQQEDPLESNLQWWNEFAIACEEINPDVYLVGEAWNEAEILAEYAQPFDSKFDFSFELDMIAAIQNEKAEAASTGMELAKSLETILEQYAACDENFIDGVFAANHDQNRILSQVGTEEKAKLAANIYLTLPGNPFIYYGEEIGMKGEKPDEEIREPFKWSSDGSDMDTVWEDNSANKETMPLKEQQTSGSNTMYRHYKELIAFRKAHTALTDGSYMAIDLEDDAVLAYVRESKEEKLLVIHNLSGKEEVIEEDSLSDGEIIYDGENKSMLRGSKINIAKYATVVVKLKR